MIKGASSQKTWLLLFVGGSYALYYGLTREQPLSASRELRMSAAASFFSPRSEDGDDMSYELRSTPMASTIETGEEDAAIRTQFQAILGAFDMNQAQASAQTLQTLKSLVSDRILLARLFKDELEALGSQHTERRDNLVWLANMLQAPELLAFWQDLALRETPRFPEEASLRNPEKANLDSRAIDIEQLQAIRNLGLIANDQAVATLTHIVLRPDPSAHRLLHREQALRALEAARPGSTPRILSQLADADELLVRIQAREP